MATSIVVFTRDLRVRDNPALAAAAGTGSVVPLFVFDDVIIRRHGHNAARMAFLAEALDDLDKGLRRLGGRLIIRRGPWARTVLSTAARAGADHIHLAADVSGYAARRLARLRSLAASARIGVAVHPGVTVAGPAELRPASAGPYQVFTPYYRQWLASPRRTLAPSPAKISLPDGINPDGIINPDSINPDSINPDELPAAPGTAARARAAKGGETAAQARLSAWTAEHLAGYDQARDDLAADATSRLSAYLHFGCLSPLELESELTGKPGADAFLRQLAWRDFYCQLLAARPDAAHNDFRDRGDDWHDDDAGLAAWKEGQTGCPVVDAAMRQLSAEGYMHNRARMIVASFLTKDLYIDWRAGAAHFMAHLADADVASNQLNWQWVAGTGTDRQPHRVFNPAKQGKRYDPQGSYVARYVPELAGLDASQIHDPPPAQRRARHYPPPIVDHQSAAAAWRERARRQRAR
ncbi:MAG TPA: deoxyribodipyrimidine photo-lyase [Streptosporangiaceae bacterium]|nr:deoxyribodipyrimidine photo-lyase [Streptosporangiaceae bacterium]